MSFKVRDIMVREVITAKSDISIKEAAKIMSKHNIGCLIITKNGKPEGIITERDLLTRVLAEGRNPDETKVGDVMSKPVICGNPDMDLEEAAKFMIKKKIKKLPIVEAGKLIGIITLTDLVRSQPYVIELLEDILSSEYLPARFTKVIRRRT